MLPSHERCFFIKRCALIRKSAYSSMKMHSDTKRYTLIGGNALSPKKKCVLPADDGRPQARGSLLAPKIRFCRKRLIFRRKSRPRTGRRALPQESSANPLVHALDNRRNSLPDADAHRRKTVLRLAPPHLVNQPGQNFCPTRAERMAERDCAAIHIHSFRIQL